MEKKFEYQSLMELLSECRIGTIVISSDSRIADLSEAGDRLLRGSGKLKGKKLSDRSVPEHVRQLCASDAADKLIYTAFGNYIRRHPVPEPADLPRDAQWIGFRLADDEYRAEIMNAILNKITEGIVACDSHEQLIYYNDAAAKVDSIMIENVLGKKVRDVYTMTDGSDVVLPRVMKQRGPYLNYRQKYVTFQGKNQDVVANAYPIIVKGQMLGAFNVVEDWSKLDDLHKEIFDLREKLVHYSKGANQKKSALSARYTFGDILHHSEAMEMVVEQCRQVAKTDSSVMIYGETGTGKELFAQSIHNASSRADGPFLAINCAALPENLLESLLFGSVKGAYTGAENRIGLFEQADHGTLLLDEINSMNINLQAKLLRVLQEGKIRKVGGSREIPVDVRVLSNINVPPYEAIANNNLRQDLFYRLGVVNINIPPLRERREDIPAMVEYFIAENNRKFSRSVRGMDQETIQVFRQYSWPGNVRELQHAVEHAMIILPDQVDLITREYIPQHLLDEEIPAGMPSRAQQGRDPGRKENLNQHLQEMEEDIIRKVLRENAGNITKSAKALNMSRQNLQYRVRRYGIDVESFRNG
ncbi:MAG: sigma 54-interacting transcriptional regulator [Eubacterium sp.]|nr:sigma 54-interacting transcriptional regulator [Eubacterium sp.]